MGSIYFSHDADAALDDKMLVLLSERGAEGYGLFWLIVERMRRAEDDGYRLKFSKLTFAAIAKLAGTDTDSVLTFVDHCIGQYELFNIEDEWFWSESLLRRMEMKDAYKEKLSEAGRKGAAKTNSRKQAAATPQPPRDQAAATPDHTNGHDAATPRQDKGKVKEKEKEESRDLQPAAAAVTEFPPGDPRGALEKPPPRLKEPIADQIEAFFWRESGQPASFGRERKACGQLAQAIKARFPEDPPAFAQAIAERYTKRIRDGDKFWSEQPASPSGLLAHFDRVCSLLRDDEEQDGEEARAAEWLRRQLSKKGILV